jgi:hypothetical protein
MPCSYLLAEILMVSIRMERPFVSAESNRWIQIFEIFALISMGFAFILIILG